MADPVYGVTTKYKPTLKERLRYFKEIFRSWLQRHPLLAKFIYLCYLILVLPFYGLLVGVTGVVIACEWVGERAKWCAKTWRERNLMKPDEIARRRKEREARYAVREFPRQRKRRLTMGERKVAIRDDVEPAPQKQIVMTSEGTGTRTKKKAKRGYAGMATVVQQRTVDQLGKSHLWRFPFEVREKIWQYAVGGHHIHIVRRRGRLGNVYCPADDPTDPMRRDLCLDTRDEHGFYKPTAWPRDVRPLSLLLSCRQV
jgi:hypothetical protein